MPSTYGNKFVRTLALSICLLQASVQCLGAQPSQIVRVTGGNQFLVDLAVSPDDKEIAVAVYDWIRLWDLETGVLKEVIPAPGVTSCAYSPDSTQLCCMLEHVGILTIDRVTHARELWKSSSFNGFHPIYSRDSRYIFCFDGDSVCKFDPSTHTLTCLAKNGAPIGDYALSMSEDTIIVNDDTGISFYGASSGKLVYRTAFRSSADIGEFGDGILRRTGNLLLEFNGWPRLRVWNYLTMKLRVSPDISTLDVFDNSAAIDMKRNSVYVGGTHNTVAYTLFGDRRWEFLSTHMQSKMALTSSLDHLILASEDGNVEVVDPQTGKLERVICPSDGWGIRQVSFNADAKYYGAFGGNALGCWDYKGNLVHDWEFYWTSMPFAFSGGSSVIFGSTNSDGGLIQRLRAGDRMYWETFPVAKDLIANLLFIDTSRYVLYHSFDSTIGIYDLDSSKSIWAHPVRRKGSYFDNSTLALTPSHDTAYFADSSGWVYVIDLRIPAIVREIQCSQQAITAISIPADPQVFYIATGDGYIEQWDARTGQRIQQYGERRDRSCRSIAVRQDGRFLVEASMSGLEDTCVTVWDAMTGEKVYTYKEFFESQQCVAISPDNKYIVAGSINGSVVLYDAVWEKSAVPSAENPGDFIVSEPYPQPSTNSPIHLDIRARDHGTRFTVELLDVAGKRVETLLHDEPMRSNSITIPTASLPSGTYEVRIIDDRSAVSRRIVVAH